MIQDGMTLEKAIEILEIRWRGLNPWDSSFSRDFADALKLGIEALKALQDRRARLLWRIEDRLPGETSE